MELVNNILTVVNIVLLVGFGLLVVGMIWAHLTEPK